jgi:solute carrier family 32 (vesicular inhibitory amino acid transporter)
MFEMTFGLRTITEGHSSAPAAESNSKRMSKRTLIGLERILFVFLAVAVSILLPDFSSMMAFLGSFSAFAICVIGPICAKIALEGSASDTGHRGTNARKGWYLVGSFDAIALGLALVMAVWGTTVAFWV